MDGLVTNASLIAGLAGGQVSAHTVVLTGVAALVAGAFSMATGEYVSVTNQNEHVDAEVALESEMHARFPKAEQDELAGYFRGYGADPDTAARMATAVSQDPDTFTQGGFARPRRRRSSWVSRIEVSIRCKLALVHQMPPAGRPRSGKQRPLTAQPDITHLS